jgi:hypothetical protein
VDGAYTTDGVVLPQLISDLDLTQTDNSADVDVPLGSSNESNAAKPRAPVHRAKDATNRLHEILTKSQDKLNDPFEEVEFRIKGALDSREAIQKDFNVRTVNS